jgi:two-component system sensor histidine kinase AlgZ
LTLWTLLGFMFGFVLIVSGKLTWQECLTITAPLTITLAFICLSPWYACRLMPLGSTALWKMIGNHLLAAVMASALLLLMSGALIAGLSGNFPTLGEKFQPAKPILTAVVIVMYVLSIAFHYAMLAVESSRKAEVLARDAELRALKAQVNPHFLFNCLNSISALTSVDAARAREMCIKLSDFLRISLRLGERPSITFGEEWELARTYLDVEQVRFGNRLRVTEKIDSDCSDCEVPPLLVQPLVENAIKHGIATLVEGGEIAISAARSSQGLTFVIENPFDPEAPRSKKSGIGLRNVRDRLRARYGVAGQLAIGIEENRYRVALSLPCDRGERLT